MKISLIADLMSFGFVVNEKAPLLHEREDITAKMIFMLQAFGGLRVSEPLHLWFNDIWIGNLSGEERCIPHLRHPSQAPTAILGVPGTRATFLASKGLSPRHHNSASSSFHAGWKNLATEESATTRVCFIHPTIEELFIQYFKYYLQYRRDVLSIRIKRGEIDHPWLFVSLGEDRCRGRSCTGNPYSINAFRRALTRAFNRVELKTGELVPRGKQFGNVPHGLRHAYAKLLVNAGAPQKAIQKALHHRHILSQEVYTAADWKAVDGALTAARNGTVNTFLRGAREYSDPFDLTESLVKKWRY